MDIGTGCGTSLPKEDLGGEIPEEKGEVDIAQVAKKVRIENVAAIDGQVATLRQEGCVGDNSEKKMPAVARCVGCFEGAGSQGNDGCETPPWVQVQSLNFSVQLKAAAGTPGGWQRPCIFFFACPTPEVVVVAIDHSIIFNTVFYICFIFVTVASSYILLLVVQ